MSQSAAIKHLFASGRIILSEYPVLSVLRYASKKFSSPKSFNKEKDKTKELGQTTVILQDRLDIQEVPAIVRKIQHVDLPGEKVIEIPQEFGSLTVPESSEVSDEHDLIEGIRRCITLKTIYSLLEDLSNDEITPNVALKALTRMIELENNTIYRNKLIMCENDEISIRRGNILNRLLNVLVSYSDCHTLLEGFKILTRDTLGYKDGSYRDKFLNEILIRVSDRKFNVKQMCEVIKMFSALKYKDKEDYIDKLWEGLIDRGRDINENNISEVFQTLPVLKKSQKMVFNMLERKIYDVWWRLSTEAVVDILCVLRDIKITSPRLLTVLARNTSGNIHTISEDSLLQILNCFSASDYIDDNIEKFLEKYVKTKGSKVKNTALVTAIAEYCGKFRLHNSNILEGCADYLIRNVSNFPPIFFKSLFLPYGILNYRPSNGLKFWQIVEHFLDEKFVQFRPDDIVDLVITCVYLEKFPVNVTKKVFNPYFLDRLHSCQTGSSLQQLRTKLKVFDTAMTLECRSYKGPLLPREYGIKTIWQDGRIKRFVKSIYDTVSDIAGSCDRVSTNVLIPQLPAADLYLLDILLHPAGMNASMQYFNSAKDHDLYIAMLIHIPEHYCSRGIYLTGPQVMKKRHLQEIGLSVVDLKYSELMKLKPNSFAMQEYLLNKLENLHKSV